MPPRVPTEADFAPLAPVLPHTLHFPSPPESTTSILILFHGLGDHDPPFAGFAQSLALPGVLGVSVRGTAPLPAAILPDPAAADRHFHWGDDLKLDAATGELDEDPGFERAERLVMDELVKGTLVAKCGWEMGDVMFFGFGQGGSLALGLASRLSAGQQVVDVSEGEGVGDGGRAFKGVVSVGGPLPMSMVSTSSARQKSATKVFVSQLDEDKVDAVKREFDDVRVERWGRGEVRMPGSQDEVLPIMKFFADRLNSGW